MRYLRAVLLGFFAVLVSSLVHPPLPAFSQPSAPAVGPSGTLEAEPVGPPKEPVGFVGYGVLFDHRGEKIDPAPEFLERAQLYYLNRLLDQAPRSVRTEAKAMESRYAGKLKEEGIDEFAFRALLIDWLVEQVQPKDRAYVLAKSRTLSGAYFKNLARDQELEAIDHKFRLPPFVLDFGFRNGFVAKKATTAAGTAYIAECREAGVPIPPTWGTNAWQYEGDLATKFVPSGNPASVYSFESTSPDGICVALPRINGSTIGLLGIICLGRETSNVCFWDKASTPVGAEVPITDFLGGDDLTDICSDCHAGRNPYVVHPGDAMDLGGKLATNSWYTPLVKPSWPQNPGPSILPEIVPVGPTDERCTNCHQPSVTGRFPEFGSLPMYCGTVLANAIPQTMPLGNPGDPDYNTHENALLAFCKQDPPDGTEVPGGGLKGDPEYVSPPVLLGPLYACVEAIEVAGLIRHAKLVVTINGVDLPPVEALNPDQQIVFVPPLVTGDLVEARQTIDGVTSQPASTTVRDHTVEYPNGLPKPEIDPTLIHECGSVIAVRHVRGAKITVFTNGGQPMNFTSAGDWTNVAPAVRPFVLNDSYTAQQFMCEDKSAISDPESAGPPPSPMPTPALDPPTTYQGQELLEVSNLAHGALTEVSESSAGLLSKFSTAVSWMPNIDIETPLGRPLLASDDLLVDSRLCEPGPRIKVRGAQPCQEMPAPAIQQPFVGQQHVVVTSAIPGARILVFDQAMKEIGDGSGNIVALSRVLQAGDVLTVLQQLGECFSATGYQVTVLCTSSSQGC